MKKYKMAKWKKILYLGGLLIGVLLSIISTLFAYQVDNDPLLNYLIGFSASLIITVIFAFLLELIAIKEENDKRNKKRKMFLLPIKNYISALFMRCTFSEWLQNEQNYTYNDFSNLLEKAFNSYCFYVDQIVDDNRNCELLNKAFNYKNGIQNYSIEPLITAIDDVLKNQFSLIADDVFTEKEIHILKSFKKSVELLKLPYLDTLSLDRNIAHENVDFPKETVNDLVKGNYKSAIKRFIGDLKNMISTFEELKTIESLEYKMK